VAEKFMRLTLTLLDSQSEISRMILESIRDHLNPIFSKTADNLKPIISKEVLEALTKESEYSSLISGQLRSELGIPDAASRIQQLFQQWSSNILVEFIPITIKGSKLLGKFSLNMIRSDLEDVLGLSAASITDSISGSVIPWLQWLSLEGTKILIRNYQIQIGPNSRSRTGNAIMVTSKQENWRVPPEFAGTIHDNWITRAIQRLDSSIPQKMQQELERNI
jgi:hypothetical protein